MKLLFKQRLLTLLDSFHVYHESGAIAFEVEGQFALGHYLKIYDAHDREVASVRQRMLTFLPTFEMYLGEQYIGSIRREFTLFMPRYHIDYKGWYVEGDFFEWDYRIYDGNGTLVATVSKELLNWTDTYTIDVIDPADALFALMLVIAIDAEKCSRKD